MTIYVVMTQDREGDRIPVKAFTTRMDAHRFCDNQRDDNYAIDEVELDLPAIERISRADLQPDDALVVECDMPVSSDAAQHIRTLVQDVWPGRKCLVLDQGLKMKVVSQ